MVGGMSDMAIPAASSSSSCLRRSSKRADEDEAKPLATQLSDGAAADGNNAAGGAGRVGTRPKGRHRRGAWRATALMIDLMMTLMRSDAEQKQTAMTSSCGCGCDSCGWGKCMEWSVKPGVCMCSTVGISEVSLPSGKARKQRAVHAPIRSYSRGSISKSRNTSPTHTHRSHEPKRGKMHVCDSLFLSGENLAL